MKSSAWDNKLWHDKMQELPLEEDQHFAWDKMHGLLDETMPVAANPGVVRKLWGLPRSLVLTLLCTAAAAAVMVLSTHYVFRGQWHNHDKSHGQHIKDGKARLDSGITDSAKIDSTRADTAENSLPATVKGDSSVTEKPLGNTDNDKTRNNNQSGQKQQRATPASGTPKQQAGLVQSQSLASGNTLAANTRSKGIARANSVSSNAPNNIPGSIVQYRGHYRKHLGTRYSNNNNGSATSQQNSVSVLQGGSSQNPSVNQISLLPPGSNFKMQGFSLISGTGLTSNGYINKLPATTSIFSDDNNYTGNAGSNNGIAGIGKKSGSGSSPSNKPAKNNTDSKPLKMKNQRAGKNPFNQGNSNFDLALEAGMNSSQNSTVPYAGVSGAYFITPKLSIGTGINLFSSRIVKGGDSIVKYPYTTTGDSGKIIKHVTGKLIVTNSQKIYTVDVPIIVSYKITNWLSVHGGVVVSIPTKTSTIVNTLTPITAPFDTTSAYRKLAGEVNSSTISNKTTVSLTGGVNLNVNRVYITAGYVQDLSPNTITSAYGKSNPPSYHALQIGIGYKLFKANPKPHQR